MKREALSERLQDVKAEVLRRSYINDLYKLDREVLGYDLMAEQPHKALCSFAEYNSINNKSLASNVVAQYTLCDTTPTTPKGTISDAMALESPAHPPTPKNSENFTKNTEKNKKLILMPRGSFKTSCVTVGLTIQEILKNPNIRILLDSETWDKSKDFLREIKGHLEGTYSPKFKEMFGTLRPEDNNNWTQSSITVSTRTLNRKEPTVSTAGIGVTKVGMHYDLIIMDDLHSEKNITTPEMIENVIDHYKLALSLLEPNGKLVVIGTRWDYSDLYSWIEDNASKDFAIYKKKAIQDDGTLLFPTRLTKSFLAEQQRSQGAFLFSCQYQNEPVNKEDATFQKDDIHLFTMEDLKELVRNGGLLNYYTTVDPAISEDRHADYSVIMTCAHDGDGNIYIVDITRGQMMPSKIIDAIEDHFQKWAPKHIAVETTAYQKALKYAINERIAKTGHYMPVFELSRDNRASKRMRIEAMQPKYIDGKIFHLSGAEWLPDIEFELLHYPNYKHDDIIDALSDQLQIAVIPKKRRLRSKIKRHFRRGRYVAYL